MSKKLKISLKVFTVITFCVLTCMLLFTVLRAAQSYSLLEYSYENNYYVGMLYSAVIVNVEFLAIYYVICVSLLVAIFKEENCVHIFIMTLIFALCIAVSYFIYQIIDFSWNAKYLSLVNDASNSNLQNTASQIAKLSGSEFIFIVIKNIFQIFCYLSFVLTGIAGAWAYGISRIKKDVKSDQKENSSDAKTDQREKTSLDNSQSNIVQSTEEKVLQEKIEEIKAKIKIKDMEEEYKQLLKKYHDGIDK